MLSSNTILVVVEMFATKQKRKLWIIFLLLLRHILEFWAIACHKICKLVNDVLELHICNAFHTRTKLTLQTSINNNSNYWITQDMLGGTKKLK